MWFQDLKPLITLLWPPTPTTNVLSNLKSDRLSWFKFRFDRNPPNPELCKVTKIQHVKLKVSLEQKSDLEGLIVETDVGLDGQPIPDSSTTITGAGERFLIIRTRGASTKVLEDVITKKSDAFEERISPGLTKKTKQVARWIKDLIHDGPLPNPHPDDYRLGDKDVLVSGLSNEYGKPRFMTFFAADDIIEITKADVSPSHYFLLDEIEVPQPSLATKNPDTSITFHKLLLIAKCVAQHDAVYSVFRRQDSWFARLILLAFQSMFGLAPSKPPGEVEGTASERDERTDCIRVSSPGGSMWKRIFIPKFEERLAREVLEQFDVRWKVSQTKWELGLPPQPQLPVSFTPTRIQGFQRAMRPEHRTEHIKDRKGRERFRSRMYPSQSQGLSFHAGRIPMRAPIRLLRSLHL